MKEDAPKLGVTPPGCVPAKIATSQRMDMTTLPLTTAIAKARALRRLGSPDGYKR
jgi:hypothetical protein